MAVFRGLDRNFAKNASSRHGNPKRKRGIKAGISADLAHASGYDRRRIPVHWLRFERATIKLPSRHASTLNAQRRNQLKDWARLTNWWQPSRQRRKSFFPARAKTTSYTYERWIRNAISNRVRRIVERTLRYYCNACKRIVQHPSRNQNETSISIGLTVLDDQKGTVAHRIVRHCENCDAEEFATLELKEQDLNELLAQIKASRSQAAAARQELASLKRAVLKAVELSPKPVRHRYVHS